MRTRGKLIAVAAVAAVAGLAVAAAGGAMAVTDREQPQPPAAKSSARAFAAGPIDSSTEAKYTAITPCRLVDTRKAGGVVTNTAPRSFDAGNAGSLAGQGGNPVGCGIPAAAVAIQANVVAVGSAGSGFLKVYPAGAPAPAASFLNFRDGKAIANGGAITVGGISAVKRFTVLTSRTSHVVVDVSGYFIKPLWALVGPTGALLQGSRTTAGSSLSPGIEVDFDRDVSNCAYDATPVSGPVNVLVQPRTGVPNGVYVSLTSPSGTATDSAFYLAVTC